MYGTAIELVIHAAEQPSHDWAAKEPLVDFDINARGTLGLLEATRQQCPRAAFVYMSTNKVYGDRPNHLPLEEQVTRWELREDHPYAVAGIDESMSVDSTLHSLFGTSKLADLMVQEYGHAYRKAPRAGEVYNMGGSRFSNCSLLEAVRLCEEISGKEMHCHYNETNRTEITSGG